MCSVSLALLIACTPGPRWIAIAAGDRAVLLLDGDFRPIATWQLPEPPVAFAANGDGLGILIASGNTGREGTATWLRRTDGALVARRQLGGPARGLWLDRGGGRVMTLVGGAPGGLSVLDADRLTEIRATSVCSEPVSLVFSPDGDRVYVTCRPGSVVEVDPALGIVVRSAWLGADSGSACGAGRGDISGNGTLIYVPCAVTGRLLYLDRATLKPWDSVAVGVGAAVAAVTPAAVAIVLLPDADRVALVNLRSKALVAATSIRNPVDLALSADGQLALVVAAGRGGAEGALLEINAQSGTQLRRAPLPPGARVVHVWPGRRESRMYWASR